MSRKKTAMGIIVLLLVLLLVSGCAFTEKYDSNNLDYYAFSANYKQDKNSEWGRRAALYQNQIYFSDSASGGVFRMGLDGSDCQLILESPDVRKLQISDEGIHYLGFLGKDSNEKGEYRSFRLFFFDWVTKRIQEPRDTPRYAQVPEEHYLELWDFYRTEQGTIANMTVGWGGTPFSGPVFDLYYTSAEGAIPEYELTSYPGHFEIASYDELYFSGKSSFVSIDPMLARYSLVNGAFSVADRQSNRLVMDTALMPIADFASGHRTIDSFLVDGVLVHIKNEMMLLTHDFQDTIQSVLLDGENDIRFVVVDEGTAYIIAEKDTQQSVYRMDLGAFAYKKLYTCAKDEKFLIFDTKKEERVLWLDAEKLVTAQGKIIRIWALVDGEYQLNRTLETDQNVVAKINKTDVAGDWLFVYQFSEQNDRDELIEKLNIALE